MRLSYAAMSVETTGVGTAYSLGREHLHQRADDRYSGRITIPHMTIDSRRPRYTVSTAPTTPRRLI